METDVKDGDSFAIALGDSDEIHGRLVTYDGRPYAEYTFIKITNAPIYSELINPISFTFEWVWCHVYRLGKRLYDTDQWVYADMKFVIDADEEKKKKLAAYDRAMGII